MFAGVFGGYCFFKTNSKGDLTYLNHLNDSHSSFNSFFKGNNDRYLWIGVNRIENNFEAAILFVDTNDHVIANKTYPDAGSFNFGTPTVDGGYLLTQTRTFSFLPAFSSFNTTIVKLDVAGNIEWRQMYG